MAPPRSTKKKSSDPKNAHMKKLRAIVAKTSTGPGIYRWLDAKGTVIYIGKAKNLRNRLKSYVSPARDATLGPWKQSLIQKIADLDITVTSTELEALILEINLIKELKPKYNVLMKDDKNYLYVRVAVKDRYPIMSTIRQMEDDGAKYFGPFLSAMSLRKTLNMLHEIFPYRACKKSLDTLNKGGEVSGNPCLDYQIGQCCGLCVGKYSEKEYGGVIEELLRFLRGDRKHVLIKLKEKMHEAAVQKKFERAAKLRDAFKYIQLLEEQQVVSDTSGANTDYIAVALQAERAQVVLLRERGGRMVGEFAFALAGQADTASAVIAQFLPQYYGFTTDIPNSVVFGEEVENQSILEDWLSERRGKRVKITVPERGKKSKLLKMAEANAEAKVQQQLAKWETAAKNIESALIELKDILGLENIPKRIEGYDISHLGGTETVGSMAVMRNGKTVNDQYRSFTIRTLKEGQVDDYAALKEVLNRRLLRLAHNIKEEEKVWDKQGIIFGKARKAESISIQEIIKKYPKDISMPDPFEYPEFLVARRAKKIVGFVRLSKIGSSLEAKSLWIDKDYRGKRLGQFLLRKLMDRAKKEKIYVTTDPKLHEYYAEIEFRHVHEPPKAIQKELNDAKKEGDQFKDAFAMVSLPSDRKEDVSLGSHPDLLVIDGGKGQLSTIASVLKELEIDIPVIGLAKKEEEVFVLGKKDPVFFPEDSQGKFMLMRLRDEAHRFANRHREKKGIKKSTRSLLDDVPGIGEKTKEILLKEFGSVAALQEASDSDLAEFLTVSQVKVLREYLL